MFQILSNQRGVIPALVLGLMALAGAGIGAATLADNADFSLFNPETSESIEAAGEQNRQMAESFIGGYSDFQRESNRALADMASTYLVEYDQLRADLLESEARHRETLRSGDTLLLLVLFGVIGLFGYLLISAFRHPRSYAGPQALMGGQVYRLEDGRLLLVDGAGHRIIDAQRPAALIHNDRGAADPILFSAIIGMIGIALIVALLAGDRAPIVSTGGDGEQVRALAESYQNQMAAQYGELLALYRSSEIAHRATIEGNGMEKILLALVGFFALFLPVAFVVAFWAWDRFKTRNDAKVVCYIQDYKGNVIRIENREPEKILLDCQRQNLIGNQRGNVRTLLMAAIFGLSLLLCGLVYARISGGHRQASPRTSSRIEAVALVFVRAGGDIRREGLIVSADGQSQRIKESQIPQALEALKSGDIRPSGSMGSIPQMGMGTEIRKIAAGEVIR